MKLLEFEITEQSVCIQHVTSDTEINYGRFGHLSTKITKTCRADNHTDNFQKDFLSLSPGTRTQWESRSFTHLVEDYKCVLIVSNLHCQSTKSEWDCLWAFICIWLDRCAYNENISGMHSNLRWMLPLGCPLSSTLYTSVFNCQRSTCGLDLTTIDSRSCIYDHSC